MKKVIDGGRTARIRALAASAFLTGGRISEVLQLQREHFLLDSDDQYIIVRSMPRVKCYRKVKLMVKYRCDGHCKMRWGVEPSPMMWLYHDDKIVEYAGWETRPVLEHRTFPIHRGEYGVKELTNYVDTLGESTTFLFPFRYGSAYDQLTRIGKRVGDVHTPPHWFRAQRASQLAFDYGFSEHDLVEFFKWKNYETAFHYASKGYKGLAAKMVR